MGQFLEENSQMDPGHLLFVRTGRVLAFSGWQQSRQLFGARLAGQSQIERITQTTALTADECALYWNGVELAYNRELGAYCLPQPLEGEPLSLIHI